MIAAKSILATFTLFALALAVDPTPAERQKWDTLCVQKAGADYRMTFDSNGSPTGRCEAPAKWKCYWGVYTDPKTGIEGCCGKDKGTFSTDPRYPTEGACCISPKVYSFDGVSRQGSCCDSGSSYSGDVASNKGVCCPTGQTYSVDAASGKGGCCTPPTVFKVDPTTGHGSCCAADYIFACDCACKPKPCNVNGGFKLRACGGNIGYDCHDYTDPACDKIGKCQDIGIHWGVGDGMTSFEVQNGCCDFYGNRDCSGGVLYSACRKQVAAPAIVAAGLNDKLGSARCRYP